MVSHLFYYQLALWAIIWLFVMLPVTGSKPGLPAPPVPAKPKRKRSTEPKAFEGLTQKPHCVLCKQETGETHPPPPIRPDPMPRTNRRPRTVDTSMHFCPHSNCDYRGWLGLNNLRANGHPNGGPWRPLAAVALHLVRWLLSRTSWHDVSWQAGGGGADRAGAGLLGRGARHSCDRTGL
jgi:hypothetical protein